MTENISSQTGPIGDAPVQMVSTATKLKTFTIAKGTKAQITQAYSEGLIGATDFAIATDEDLLDNKADKDLSNVSALGKETVVGWGIPDYSAGVDMGAGTTHTATRKGWVMFKASTAPSDGVIQINGIEFSKSSRGNYGTAFDTVQEFIPVDVGDTFFITNNASAVCIFYPCKGVN